MRRALITTGLLWFILLVAVCAMADADVTHAWKKEFSVHYFAEASWGRVHLAEPYGPLAWAYGDGPGGEELELVNGHSLAAGVRMAFDIARDREVPEEGKACLLEDGCGLNRFRIVLQGYTEDVEVLDDGRMDLPSRSALDWAYLEWNRQNRANNVSIRLQIGRILAPIGRNKRRRVATGGLLTLC